MINKYPYTDFNEYNMDWIIKTIKDLTVEWAETKTEWSDTKTEWENYKNYIDNYFNSLDVTAELTTIVNGLVADGTIYNIFHTTMESVAASITSDWIADNLLQESGYVIDNSLTVSNAAADAAVTGDNLRRIENELVKCYEVASEYTITDLVSGERYVSTGIQINADYKRAPFIYPVKPFQLLQCNEVVSGDEMSFAFYDKDMNFIERKYVYTPYTLYATCWAPIGAAYAGFSVKTINTETEYKFYIVGDGKCDNIDVNMDRNLKSYLYIPNRVITAGGNMNDNTAYDVIIVPYPNADTMYCSYNIGSNGMTIDDSGNKVFLTATTVTGEDYARRYTIPSNTKILFICYPNNAQKDEDGNISAYVNLIRKNNNPLNNKKVTCIGASATRMDQHSVAASGCTGAVVGWQKWLKWNGAFCSNRGKNGYCYATGYGSGSLYTDVVTNAMDLSSQDIVILFGGQNDAQYDVPIGSAPTSYGTIDSDPSTMCGAINGIMQYIRLNYPTVKVYMLTPYKANLASLGFGKVKQYYDAIKACAEFWSCDLIDVFSDCNLSPGYNTASYLYDNIHPNSKGFALLGKIIAQKIKASSMK